MEEEKRREGNAGEDKKSREGKRKEMKRRIETLEDVRPNVEGNERGEQNGRDGRQLDGGLPTWGVSYTWGAS